MNQILKIPFVATKLLQCSKLTMSDLFGCWLNMGRKLENILKNEVLSTDLAELLHEKISQREQILIENPMLVTAVYMDARFNFKLTGIQIETAKSTLVNSHRKIKQNEVEQSVEQPKSVD